jgi:hypothetical protein
MNFLILSLFCSSLQAEYRAFELVIRDPTSGQERTVISTLDPNQYRRWNPVKPEERIFYKATWRCRGNTSDFKPICPRPAEN